MARVGAAVITGAAISLEVVLLTGLARLMAGDPPAIPDLALLMVWSLVYAIPFALVLAFLLPEIGRAMRRNSRLAWLCAGAFLGALLGLAGYVAVVRSPALLVLPVLAVALFGATAGILLHILQCPESPHVTPVTPPPGANP